jgi:hypothetical protein
LRCSDQRKDERRKKDNTNVHVLEPPYWNNITLVHCGGWRRAATTGNRNERLL